MRKPTYLSPSALGLWNKDRKEYYLRYLAETRPPGQEQTQPMSVGSAFDAYCKSDMHWKIFGNYGKEDQFRFETIFETQVSEGNRDFAKEAGRVCMERYKEVGAMADLMSEIAKGIGEPRFEIAIMSTIGVKRDYGGVPVLGKPDCLFRNCEGATVILDWKVNGYCGRSNTSPMKGYLKCRPEGRMHEDCLPRMYKGMMVNMGYRLEELKEDWAAQLATYGWAMGEPVGSEFITWIDQLACAEYGSKIRVATHRMRVGEQYQYRVLNEYQKLWDAVQSGYIFTDMTREDNDAYCATLDNIHENYTLEGGNQTQDDFFNEVTRGNI